MAYAKVYNSRTDSTRTVEYANARMAAENLVVLMAASGWNGGKELTIGRLLQGDAVEFLSRTYSVTETP